jgi:hypothetical protein
MTAHQGLMELDRQSLKEIGTSYNPLKAVIRAAMTELHSDEALAFYAQYKSHLLSVRDQFEKGIRTGGVVLACVVMAIVVGVDVAQRWYAKAQSFYRQVQAHFAKLTPQPRILNTVKQALEADSAEAIAAPTGQGHTLAISESPPVMDQQAKHPIATADIQVFMDAAIGQPLAFNTLAIDADKHQGNATDNATEHPRQ